MLNTLFYFYQTIQIKDLAPLCKHTFFGRDLHTKWDYQEQTRSKKDFFLFIFCLLYMVIVGYSELEACFMQFITSKTISF